MPQGRDVRKGWHPICDYDNVTYFDLANNSQRNSIPGFGSFSVYRVRNQKSYYSSIRDTYLLSAVAARFDLEALTGCSCVTKLTGVARIVNANAAVDTTFADCICFHLHLPTFVLGGAHECCTKIPASERSGNDEASVPQLIIDLHMAH